MAGATFEEAACTTEQGGGGHETRDFTLAGPISTGDVIIVQAAWYGDITPATAIADSLGLTWNVATWASQNGVTSDNFDGYIWWARVVTGGSSVNIEFTSTSGQYGHFGGARFSGVDSTGDPWETGCTAVAVGISSTADSGNTGATAQSDGMALAFVWGNLISAGTPTAQSTYTQRASNDDSGGQIAMSIQTKVVNASTASAQFGNDDKSSSWYAAAMILKGSGGGGGAAYPPSPARVRRLAQLLAQ